MIVTVEFNSPNVTVNESDGFVTVELLRIGNNSDSFNVCISIMMIAEPAIVECTYVYVCTYAVNDLCIKIWVCMFLDYSYHACMNHTEVDIW